MRPFYYALAQLCIAIHTVQVSKCFLQPLNETHFAKTLPCSRIVVLFVWFVGTFWVANLAMEISVFLIHIVFHAFCECPLHVSVDIHFYSAILYCLGNFLFLRT